MRVQVHSADAAAETGESAQLLMRGLLSTSASAAKTDVAVFPRSRGAGDRAVNGQMHVKMLY